MKHIPSKLTQTTPGDDSIMAITTTEWANVPEVPKIEKIPIDDIEVTDFSAIDYGQQNFYVSFLRHSIEFVRRYEIDGETLIYRSEKEFGSIDGMCVVKDQLVILENCHELELTMLDKYTLEVVEVAKINLPDEINGLYNRFTIAGYADVLIVLLFHCEDIIGLRHLFALLTGKHIEMLGNDCRGSISCGSWNRLFLCDKNTIMAYDIDEEPNLRFIDFNENEITRTRSVTIKDLIYISCASFKPFSMLSPLKGYLFIWGKYAGSSSNCVKAVKIDIESLKDGSTLSARTIPELSGSQCFLSHSSAQTIVCQYSSGTFLLHFVH